MKLYLKERTALITGASAGIGAEFTRNRHSAIIWERFKEEFAATNISSGVFGDPGDIGSLVAFIASPRAQQIMGSVLYVDGGMKRFAH